MKATEKYCSWKTNRQMLVKDARDQHSWGITFIQSCVVVFKYRTTVENILLLFCHLRPPYPLPHISSVPHSLTAPEGQMNSTFLPSWAVTGPHTAEARLINETQQDSRWQLHLKQPAEKRDSDRRPASQSVSVKPHRPAAASAGPRGPRCGAVVNHNCARVASNLVLSGNVVKICCSSLQRQGFIQ